MEGGGICSARNAVQNQDSQVQLTEGSFPEKAVHPHAMVLVPACLTKILPARPPHMAESPGCLLLPQLACPPQHTPEHGKQKLETSIFREGLETALPVKQDHLQEAGTARQVPAFKERATQLRAQRKITKVCH